MSSKKTTRQELRKKITASRKVRAKEEKKKEELTEEEILFGKPEPEVSLGETEVSGGSQEEEVSERGLLETENQGNLEREVTSKRTGKISPSKGKVSLLVQIKKQKAKEKSDEAKALMKVKVLKKEYKHKGPGQSSPSFFKEETKRRAFFRSLLTMTVDDKKRILFELKNFAHEKGAFYSREGFINKIINRLDVDLILKFAQEFTDTPEDVMSGEYINDFIEANTTEEEDTSLTSLNEHQKRMALFKEIYLLGNLSYPQLEENIMGFIMRSNPNEETVKLIEDLLDLKLETDYGGISTILIESYVSNFFKKKTVSAKDIEKYERELAEDVIDREFNEEELEIFGETLETSEIPETLGLVEVPNINEFTLMKRYKSIKNIPRKVEEMRKNLTEKRMREFGESPIEPELFGETEIIPRAMIPRAERKKKLETMRIVFPEDETGKEILGVKGDKIIEGTDYEEKVTERRGYTYPEDELIDIAKLLREGFSLENVLPKNKIVTLPAEEYTRFRDKRCIDFYLSYAWLPYRVTGIWVQPLNDADVDYYDPEDYKSFDIDGESEEFYRPENAFIEAQCGIYRGDRKQEGDVLSFKDPSGNIIRFKVLFEMGETFRIQDEALFEKEKKLYSKVTKGTSSRIKDFGDRTVNMFGTHDTLILKELLRENVISTLIFPIDKKELMVGEITDYFYTTYINDKLSDLFMAFSAFISKFGENVISFSNILKDRLRMGYYTVMELISISVEELIAEVFLDKNRTPKESERVYKYLEINVSNTYNIILHTFYYSINLGERVAPLYLKENIDVEVDGKHLGDICSSVSDPYKLYIIKVEGGNNEEGGGDGRYLCFDLENLESDLEKYSLEGVDIPDDDIIKMRKMSGRLTSLKIKPVETEKIDITPTKAKSDKELYLDLLIKEVIDDILELEEGMGIKGENYYIITKDPESTFDEQLHAEVKLEKYCEYCETEINGDSPLKSIMKHKEGSKIVNFCNTRCFELMEKWPKYKSKKDALVELNKEKPKIEESPPVYGPGENIFPESFNCAVCDISVDVPEGDFPLVKGGKHVCEKCYHGLTDNKAYLDLLKREEEYSLMKDKKCAFCGKGIPDKAWRSGEWNINGKETVLHFDSFDHFEKYFKGVDYRETEEYTRGKKKKIETDDSILTPGESCECDPEGKPTKNNCSEGHEPLCVVKNDLEGNKVGYSCICIEPKKEPSKREGKKGKPLKHIIPTGELPDEGEGEGKPEGGVHKQRIRPPEREEIPTPTGIMVHRKSKSKPEPKKVPKEVDVEEIIEESYEE